MLAKVITSANTNYKLPEDGAIAPKTCWNNFNIILY